MLARLKPTGTWAVATLLATGLMVGVIAPRAWTWVQVDWLTLRLQHQVARWGASGTLPNPATFQAAERDLMRATRLNPNDAAIQDMLGALYTLQGNTQWDDTVARTLAYRRALPHQERSVALRPYVAQGWANLVLTKYVLQQPMPEIEAAWQQAFALGPHEREVKPILINVALGRWAEATPPMRAWITELHEQRGAQERDRIDRWAAYYGLSLNQ